MEHHPLFDFPAVEGITDNRMPDCIEMHPDLMGPSGMQDEIQERTISELAKDGVFGQCLTPIIVGTHRHFLSIAWIPPDMQIDGPFGILHFPGN